MEKFSGYEKFNLQNIHIIHNIVKLLISHFRSDESSSSHMHIHSFSVGPLDAHENKFNNIIFQFQFGYKLGHISLCQWKSSCWWEDNHHNSNWPYIWIPPLPCVTEKFEDFWWIWNFKSIDKNFSTSSMWQILFTCPKKCRISFQCRGWEKLWLCVPKVISSMNF